MLKHIALALALTMGACLFAQAPVPTAKPTAEAADAADKFSGIGSMVQLVKLRRQLLLRPTGLLPQCHNFIR